MDTIFIMMSLNNNFNLRRIERYMIQAQKSRAKTVLVLSKSDLAFDINTRISDVKSVSGNAEVLAVSTYTGFGIDKITGYLESGKTIALFGSSGVGKSTLINFLIGNDLLKTNDIRYSDDEGRHTTTWRELIMLPNGAMILDTPGLREVGISAGTEDVKAAFEDIYELILKCKFQDCSHTNEPGCAVAKALENGELDKKHYNSYLKLKKENDYYENKNNIFSKNKEKQRWKNISKLRKKIKNIQD
jgi:ribosome biogenesis GTPase / thiamine phosphate phosphatase